jgi:hypothetical protein
MPILFVCRCGKCFKDREDIAGHRAVCSAIKTPVEIPTVEPTHCGTESAQPSFLSLNTTISEELLLETESIRLRRPPRWHRLMRNPRLERNWYESLRYSIPVFPVQLQLAGVLTLLTAVLFLLLSTGRDLEPPEWPVPLIIPLCLFVTALALGHACTFLSDVLVVATNGKAGVVSWPENDMGQAMQSFGRWAGCFLAGPALFIGAGVAY